MTLAPPLRGISGMVYLGAARFLVVHDARTMAEPRAGILDTTQGVSYRQVSILDFTLPGGPLRDVEAVAAMPGDASAFLLLESGSHRPGENFRRILALARLQGETLRVEATIDVAPFTAGLADCEGLIAYETPSGMMIAIADRTNAGTAADPALTLAVGRLSRLGSSTLGWKPLEDVPQILTLPRPLVPAGGWRVCTDLCLDSRGILWGVSALDRGNDGPFSSDLYTIGSISTLGVKPGPAYNAANFSTLKVEALAIAPDAEQPSWIATDDETYGGIWRPLGPLPAVP